MPRHIPQILLLTLSPLAFAQGAGEGEPPVPYPTHAEIHDRNGDGIADSIRITYSAAFTDENLPNKLQIIWAPKDTISYGLAKKAANGIYTNEEISPTANKRYWAQYIKKGETQDTIVITAEAFSSKIKTAFHNIGEKVISWSTYKYGNETTNVTSIFSCTITDKIPPIIISAQYEGGDDINRIIIELSEPVERTQGTASFAYKLQSKGPNATFEPIDPPQSTTWALNDSSVVLGFGYAQPPGPGDSVRILDKLGSDPESHEFKDLAGNGPNPNEIGRKIEGRERFKTSKNLIAAIDIKNAEQTLAEAMERRFGNLLANKFLPDEPITLLPIPETWQGEFLQDSLNKNYPNTLGPVFWPEPKFAIQDLEAKLGRAIPRNKIIFTANSIYHTSYGNYSAKSGELKIDCDNAMFKIDGAKDCANSNIGVYMAWNLKDNKNRWAGAGTYVQIYSFQWEIKNEDPKINGIINDYSKEGKTAEKYGVVRAAKRWKLTF